MQIFMKLRLVGFNIDHVLELKMSENPLVRYERIMEIILPILIIVIVIFYHLVFL